MLQVGLEKSQATDIVLPSLTILLRKETCRQPFTAKGGINLIVQTLNKLGRNGNAQQLYELTFCLWTLSLGDNADIEAFLHCGTILTLTELVAAAPSRKVVRMALASLLNLTHGSNEGVLTEMLTGGLTKMLENMIHSNAHKQAGDPEVESDVRNLFEILMKNYRDFSTYDRWMSEVKTGNLRSLFFSCSSLLVLTRYFPNSLLPHPPSLPLLDSFLTDGALFTLRNFGERMLSWWNTMISSS
jgi:hypothetical protein